MLTRLFKKMLHNICRSIKWLFKEEPKPVTAPRRIFNDDITIIDLDKETDVLDVDLISDNLTLEEKTTLRQTTKVIVWTLIVAAIIWITWSYILATVALVSYSNTEVLLELSIEVLQVILGSVIGYMCKSFIETFAQKTSEMIERRWEKKDQSNTQNASVVTNNDDEAVG